MDVTMPDGTVIEGVPDGATKAQLAAKYAAHIGGQAAPAGPPPTLLDRAIASPIGRGLHDVVGGALHGAADMATMMPLLSGAKPGVDMVASAVNKPYEASLARNRNTPGYAKALAEAQGVQGMRGSGLSDQLTAPFNPAMAGLAGAPGGFDTMNANADAQASAQQGYQQRHPILSTMGQMTGGLLMAPKMSAPPAASSVAPSIATLKNDARAAYNAADQAGHVVSAPSFDTMVGDLQAKLANEGVDKTLHPNALAAFKRLEEAKGNPITFKGLDTLRKVAGDAIGASVTNKADQRLGHLVQDHIDDFVGNLKQTDILGGADPKAAINALADARDAWSRASQAQTIQTNIEKAQIKSAGYSQSGMENALRAQFRQLALNTKAMSRLSPEVQDAVKAVAKGSPVSNVLRAIGKYAPHGPVSTMAGLGIGSMLGGPMGAAEGGMASLAVPAVGEAARAGATSMTKAAAQRALNTAALGHKPPSIPGPLQLPSLTNRSRLPLGLPLLLQPQNQ